MRVRALASCVVFAEPFCFRQFDDPKYPGTVIPMDKDMFMKQVNHRAYFDAEEIYQILHA